MSSMNWDRVRAEGRDRRNGWATIGPHLPKKKKKSKPMKSKPPEKQNQNHSPAESKKECKVVPVQIISGYLECEHGKLVRSLQHLANANGAVEVAPGEWVLIQRMPAPPYPQPGKLITIQPRNRKAEPTKSLDGAAQSIDHQTNAYRHQDAGDDGRAQIGRASCRERV